MDEPYLTVKDVAEMMQVVPRTVHRWVRLGRLRPLRIGHTTRFSRADLLAALEKYENGDPRPKNDPMMG